MVEVAAMVGRKVQILVESVEVVRVLQEVVMTCLLYTSPSPRDS